MLLGELWRLHPTSRRLQIIIMILINCNSSSSSILGPTRHTASSTRSTSRQKATLKSRFSSSNSISIRRRVANERRTAAVALWFAAVRQRATLKAEYRRRRRRRRMQTYIISVRRLTRTVTIVQRHSYHPRVRRCNAFCRVWLCVCNLKALKSIWSRGCEKNLVQILVFLGFSEKP